MANAAARVRACAPACAPCTPSPRILPPISRWLIPNACNNHKLNRDTLLRTPSICTPALVLPNVLWDRSRALKCHCHAHSPYNLSHAGLAPTAVPHTCMVESPACPLRQDRDVIVCAIERQARMQLRLHVACMR
jgi:hypothetical protein